MADTAFRQSIYDLLANWRGLDSLKNLFWSQLNYERVNQPIARSGWPRAAAEALADQPLVFAEAGDGGQFKILYARLAAERLRLTDERAVVNRLLREYPYALFVFSDKDQKRWHLVNVKDAPRLAQQDEDRRPRLLFRRIALGPEERVRTAAERLTMLDVESIQRELFGLSPLAIQKAHDVAFDVEAVTRDFFTHYAEIFAQAEAKIKGVGNDERKRLFTQRLFNRLMFIAFIQKKGWLNFNGDNDYLLALWRDYQSDKEPDKNFYRDRLYSLFFFGLNTPHEQNLVAINRGGDFLSTRIGRVPYLNGGLFEEADGDREARVPDAAIAPVLTDLFYRFNFTITESTPFDVEVAVDPEMLGKIFEELVTGRHESGSYYTPKPVVSFMCREAIKRHLHTHNPRESFEAITRFVEDHDPAGLRDPESALAALRTAKACDPACGSGAYLLGLLHELLDLRAALFVARQLDARTVYERKLEIIQSNLYGVDKDEFAVNIARLRLWLSLVVDYEGDDPPPLPNLDFKIETGDSLTAPDPSDLLKVDMFRQAQLKEFYALKEQYLTAHHGEKLELKKRIEALRGEIAEWAHPSQKTLKVSKTFRVSESGFDWAVEFAEVFAPDHAPGTLAGALTGVVNAVPGQMQLAEQPAGGFDIVLANPPYVRADAQFKHIEDEKKRQEKIEEWRAFREQLKSAKIYKTLHEKWDLYIPFLERAYQLLQPGGQMVFIIPDAYNAAKYAGKSHEFFLQNTRVERIDFCSEIDLFDAGVNNTILHFEKGAPLPDHQPIRVWRWGKRDEFDDNQRTLAIIPQTKFGTALFRPIGTKNDSAEGSVTLETICYVSVGMVIHADEKKAQGLFRAEDLVSEVQDKKHPKPYVEGKDISRWGVQRIRYLEYWTKRAPSMFRRPTFIELHESPEKLMAFRMCGENIAVAYDNQRLMSNHTVILCVPWHFLKGVMNRSIRKAAEYRHQNPDGDREQREKVSQGFLLHYVLAIMNSGFAKRFLNEIRQSKIDIYPDEWKQLPIAPIPLDEQKPFVTLVNNILREYEKHGYPLPPKSAEKVKEWERQLDEMVERLYEAG
jgi:methylase of polypeptide subunit release factors